MARLQGQSAEYVGEEGCPTRRAVLTLAAAMQLIFAWGVLAVHLAVGTGLRMGEQFQLTADDIEITADGTVYVRVDWQWCNDAARGRRAEPKHRKRRVIPVAPLTRDGYRLAECLLARVAQARAEQRGGGNPQGLLFPAPQGGMWWPSGLTTDIIVPAMKAAGWQYTVVHEMRTLRTGQTERVAVTQMHRTWHSLRHRFARDMIDYFHLPEGPLMAIGGWESIDVVQARHYRTGAEHVAAAAELLRQGPRTS